MDVVGSQHLRQIHPALSSDKILPGSFEIRLEMRSIATVVDHELSSRQICPVCCGAIYTIKIKSIEKIKIMLYHW
jgi:hypothetical protein